MEVLPRSVSAARAKSFCRGGGEAKVSRLQRDVERVMGSAETVF